MCRAECDNICIDENIALERIRDFTRSRNKSFGGNLKLTTVLLLGDEEATGGEKHPDDLPRRHGGLQFDHPGSEYAGGDHRSQDRGEEIHVGEYLRDSRPVSEVRRRLGGRQPSSLSFHPFLGQGLLASLPC